MKVSKFNSTGLMTKDSYRLTYLFLNRSHFCKLIILITLILFSPLFTQTSQAFLSSGPSCSNCHVDSDGSFDISRSTVEVLPGESGTATFDLTYLPSGSTAAFAVLGMDDPGLSALSTWTYYGTYYGEGFYTSPQATSFDFNIGADAIPGDYNISVTLAGGTGFGVGRWSASSSFTIRVLPFNQVPIADAGGPYSGDRVQPVQFDGSGSYDPDGSIVSYEWDFGDGSSGTGVNPSHTYAALDEYTVTLTVTDDVGQTDTDTASVYINHLFPVADHGGPYAGQVGEPVQFDGSGSYDPDGTITSYSWNFGDGTQAFGVNPTHVYTAAGIYTVTLTVIDNQFAITEVMTTAVITQIINQSPVADAGGPYFGNSVQPIQFNGSGSNDPDGSIVSYEWDFGDGSSGTGVNPSHTYAGNDIYTVTLTVTDDKGAIDTDTATVHIDNWPPEAHHGGPYTGQVGESVQFDGSGSNDTDGSIVSYNWDFGDGSSGTGVNPTHTYLAAGTYTVMLTVTDNNGASDASATTAEISQTPNQPPEATSGGPYEGQINESVQFNGSGSYDPDGSIVSYDWDFGDGGIGTGVNPTHIYTTTGTYVVTLTATDNDGDSDTDTTTAAIDQTDNQSPVAVAGGPYAGYTVYLPVQFDGSGSYDSDGTIVSYEWDFGDGSSGTGMAPSHYYESSGEYTVTLAVTDDVGQTDTDTTTVYIESLSPPEPILGGPYAGQVGEPVQFDGSGSYDPDGSIASYEWDFGDGTNATGVNPTHIYTAAGTYTVALTVFDDDSNWAKFTTTAVITQNDNQSPTSNRYVDIAAGLNHSLALKQDGSIVCWGSNEFGQADPPDGNDFIAIATGSDGNHNLALRKDGSIVGWGDDEFGQASPPAGNDFIAIAAGFRHSLALKSDGSIIAWGRDNFGQSTPPAGNDFIAIAAGTAHSLALKSDGSILAWGRNAFGQSDSPAGNDFVAIAGGGQFSLAIKSDGSIVAWGGKNTHGQASPPAGNDFIAVSAGKFHALALKSDGTIAGWGNDEFGQATGPVGNDFVAIAAGGYHSLALKEDGTIVNWGDNQYGQAIPPVGDNKSGNSISIAAGYFHSLALGADGRIVGWGNNVNGQADPPDGNDFVAISAGNYYSLALKSDGSLAGWGYDSYGQATPPEGNDFVAVAAGSEHSLALKSDGSIIGWGRDDDGRASPPEGNDFVAIEAGRFHSLALKSDGSLVAWGRNLNGQTNTPAGNDFVAIAAGNIHNLALKADGSIVQWGDIENGQGIPPEGNDFIAISAGTDHSLALRADGSIVAWGNNTFDKAIAPAGNGFVAIAAGGSHNLAVKADGTIIGWGSNEYGQTTSPSKENTVQIDAGNDHSLALKPDGSIIAWGSDALDQAIPPAGNDFVAIDAGAYHNLAIKSDGSIVAWGYDFNGQSSGAPLGNDFAAIAAGNSHSLALKSDGSIVGWGQSDYGLASLPEGNDYVAIDAGVDYGLALKSDGSLVGWGDGGGFGQSDTPAGNDFVAIAAGDYHALALKSDGSITGWGANFDGESSPPAGNDFVTIAAGGSFSLALKSDGSIVGWGDNYSGKSSPPSGNDFVTIAAGKNHGLAVKSDGTIVGWGYNGDGQINVPEGNDF